MIRSFFVAIALCLAIPAAAWWPFAAPDGTPNTDARLDAVEKASAGVFNVAAYSVKANGIADDSPGLQSAIDDAPSGALVRLPPGIYGMKTGLVISKPLTLDCNGATLKFIPGMNATPANNWIRVISNLGTARTLGTGQLPAGTRTFTADADPSVVASGTVVFQTLGTDPYDATQPFTRMFNLVESVTTVSVTMRIPSPEYVTTSAGPHKFYVPTSIAENVRIVGCKLDYSAGLIPDQGIIVESARNVTIQNVQGVNTTGALVEVRNSENVIVDGVYCQRADRNVHSSSGRCVGGWGSRNVTMRNVYSLDADGTPVFFESQMRQLLLENIFVSAGPGVASIYNAVHIVGGSLGVTVRGLHVLSTVARPAIYSAQGADVRTEDLYLWGGNKATRLDNHSGSLWHAGALYKQHRRYTTTFRLTPSMSAVAVSLPTGIIKRLRVYVSSATGVTAFYVVNTTNGQGVNIVSNLVGGSVVGIPAGVGIGDDYPINAYAGHTASIYSNGTVPQGAWGRLDMEYIAPDAQDDGTAADPDARGLTRATAIDLNSACTITTAAAEPTTACRVCDMALNTAPTAGGPPGWTCVDGAGTWRAWGNLAP